MRRWLLWLAVTVTCGLVLSPDSASGMGGSTAAEQGQEVVLRHPLNPALWSLKAYENAWKQWGLAERPVDYDRTFRERYGLLAASYDNHGLPLGLMESRSLWGKGIVNNCLLCHAGRVAGRTYIGLGNASLDLQSLFDELSAADHLKLGLPFQFSYVRGTIDAVSPVAFLMSFRDADLNVQKPVDLPLCKDVCSDPPAWWLIKRKKTRDWTGGIDARSTRVDLVNLLSPFHSGAHIKKQEQVFADILAFLHSIEPPKYPFAIDGQVAERGRTVFNQRCARCHGTYGPDGKYPNKIIPLEKIGTDPVLAEAVSEKTIAYLNKSWLAQEVGADGKRYQFTHHLGYQAPPLDGIWATAPYFHNGSVPTIYHVLNSKARPNIFTRSFHTGEEDYDPIQVGWKVQERDKAPDSASPGIERRKVYDTTQRGRSNGGHRYGDELTEEERLAVIEYLKTL